MSSAAKLKAISASRGEDFICQDAHSGELDLMEKAEWIKERREINTKVAHPSQHVHLNSNKKETSPGKVFPPAYVILQLYSGDTRTHYEAQQHANTQLNMYFKT